MFRLSTSCLLFGCCVSCGQRKPSEPVVVHVLRDPRAQFAGRLRQADLKFGLTSARVKSGKYVVVATNEGGSYDDLLGRVANVPPSLLIVDSQATLPAQVASQVRLEPPKLVCGGAAYIPEKILQEEREAAEMYLRFLEGHCESQ
jgi:hypothetical protein